MVEFDDIEWCVYHCSCSRSYVDVVVECGNVVVVLGGCRFWVWQMVMVFGR